MKILLPCGVRVSDHFLNTHFKTSFEKVLFYTYWPDMVPHSDVLRDVQDVRRKSLYLLGVYIEIVFCLYPNLSARPWHNSDKPRTFLQPCENTDNTAIVMCSGYRPMPNNHAFDSIGRKLRVYTNRVVEHPSNSYCMCLQDYEGCWPTR